MNDNIAKAQAAWHGGCIACGRLNPMGLRLAFASKDDGSVEATFPCAQVFEGYGGRVHGGVVATLLDAAMTNCLFARGIAALTGELTIRFRHSVDIAAPACVRAWVERSSRPLYLLRAELIQREEVKARASGKFMEARSARDGSKAGRGAP